MSKPAQQCESVQSLIQTMSINSAKKSFKVEKTEPVQLCVIEHELCKLLARLLHTPMSPEKIVDHPVSNIERTVNFQVIINLSTT